MSFMFAVAILGLLLPGWWRLTAAVLPVVYGATLLGVGAGNAGKVGWRVALLFPVAAAIIHAAYAAGFATGLIKGTNRLAEDVPTNKGECHATRT